MTHSLIENRQIRVFVSSTFQDMKNERDYLMTKVFPRLRKKAAERDVSFVELDLRWGITEKEAQSGKVVQICLNEIENSQPFFIGLLGDRYGWCPPASILEQDSSLTERYPWIRKDIDHGISVTEIEMRYGVLRRETDNLNAYFFIKADSDMTEPKQMALKNAVRNNTRYPCKDYTTVEELGSQVEAVFTELLERLFPQTELTSLELERLAQRSFLHSRCNVYIRNEANFEELNNFLHDKDARYLVLTGESGMGKSALIANWLSDHRNDDDYYTIYHFVGNSSAEGDYNSILSRLIDEIYDLYNLPQPAGMQVEQNRSDPKEILQQLFLQIANKKPLLIVLDGINQLAEREGEQPKLLNWLPPVPKGCKMLFSTLEDDETMATFHRREYPVYHLKPLYNAQRQELIVDYLSRYGKGLTEEQVARIANDSKTQNMLVLRTLLDELLCFGIHEQLDARIDYYLAAENIGDFFQRVLQRAEEDYGLEVVRDTLALIIMSYEGMSETELLEIAHISPLRWSAFYCAFNAHFTVKNGLINFSHSYLQDAVVERYHTTESKTIEFCHRIINYFTNTGEFTAIEEKSENTRAWSELAHQYYCISLNKELHALVLRPEVFKYFFDKMRLVLIWQQLRADTSCGYSLDDYLVDKENTDAQYYLKVGNFCYLSFREFGTSEKAYNVGLTLYRCLAANNLDAFDSEVAITLNNLGWLHCEIHDYVSAERELREALEIYRRLASKNPTAIDIHLATTLNNLGELHRTIHDCVSAEKELREALEIWQRLTTNEPDAFDSYVAITLNNLGLVHFDIHDYVSAEKEYRESLEIYLRLASKNPTAFDSVVAKILNNLGKLHLALHDYISAEKELREALEINQRLTANDPDAFDSYVAITLNNLGELHLTLHDYVFAEKELREALEIYLRLASNNPTAFDYYVARILNNLGLLHYDKEDYVSAGKYFMDSLDIYQRLSVNNPDLFKPYVANILNNLNVMQPLIKATQIGTKVGKILVFSIFVAVVISIIALIAWLILK